MTFITMQLGSELCLHTTLYELQRRRGLLKSILTPQDHKHSFDCFSNSLEISFGVFLETISKINATSFLPRGWLCWPPAPWFSLVNSLFKMYSSAGQYILIGWSKFKSLISENKKLQRNQGYKIIYWGQNLPMPYCTKNIRFHRCCTW